MNSTVSPVNRLPSSRRDWSRLLASLGVQPSKGMGQHFLVERGVVERIVRTAGVTESDVVVEVGPGLGVLTAQLLSTRARVVAIELDRELALHLRRLFGDLEHFRLVEADALKIDLEPLVESLDRYSVVSNLPYSVGSAVLMRFLELPHPPDRLTVMVQHEVAERLIGRPPEMTVLGVATQVLAKARVAFTVTPGNFMPPPKVDSAVVVLEAVGEQRLARSQRGLFFSLVNAGFRHKRKQIANSIAIELDLPKDVISERLMRARIDPLRRAQTLGVDEWLALLDVWERAGAPA